MDVNESPDPDRGASVESARRVLALLMSFSKQRHTLSARDLAAATRIPLPSVYRYVAFLRELGFLVERHRGRYHLSGQVLALAAAAHAAEPLIDIAAPIMRRLAAATGETVILVRLVAHSSVCIHRVESNHHLRISYEPGQPLPLDRGASGRLLLASMTAAARREYLAALADSPPGRVAWLEEQVALAGRRGWAASEQEIGPGVWAAAAAVRDDATIIASLSIPSPLARATKAMQDQLLARVCAAAEEISGDYVARRG